LDLTTLEGTLVVTHADGSSDSASGTGAAVLGHPAEAVAWLARALDTLSGERIEAGEIILPGAVSRALPIVAGDTVHADFGTLGVVRVSVGSTT
jgi:2-keto-4-pentenoate hydratase